MEKEPKEEVVNDFIGEKEKTELSFNEGVDKATRRIFQLLTTTDHDLIVGINGSGMNVGKTYLKRTLMTELFKRGVPFTDLLNPNQKLLQEMRISMERIKDLSGGGGNAIAPFGVYFVENGIPPVIPFSTESYRQRVGGSPTGVACDLYIGIYRPDKPFEPLKDETILGDIVIRNEEARDKK